MEDGSWSLIVIFILMLLMACYFAVAETAFATVNKIRMKNRADRGDPRAIRAMEVLNDFDKAITTILIGTNISHIVGASISTLFVTRLWGNAAVTVSTFVTTLIVFFFGEMLPKSFAKKYCESLSLWASGSMRFLMKAFTPISFLLTKFGQFVANLTKGDGEVSVTEDELYDIIENLTEEGSLDEEKGELVYSALEFDDVSAGDIITARVDLVAIDIDDPPAEVLEKIKNCKHSRLPVYRDTIDNIIGVLQIRKYIKACIHEKDAVDLESVLDEPYFAHSSMKVDELLRELSRRKLNLAVITDSSGGTQGIVTVEDILEELVGELWDEDDVVIDYIVSLGEDTFDVSAAMQVEDAFEEIGFEDPQKHDLSHKTLGDWVYEQFDSIPEVGDSFDYEGLHVSVSRKDERRLLRVTMKLPEKRESNDEEAAE